MTVTHNSSEHLRACWSNVDLGDSRWVVVDNASEDDSVDVARDLGAAVLPLPGNIGFGAANNIGLAGVDTEWIAFVNPDLRLRSHEDLGRLAQTSLAIGSLVAPQLLNSDGTEQPNARGLPFVIDKIANRSLRLPGARLHEYVRTGLREPTYAAWVIGAAVAGPTQLFRSLGGWDDRFFIYYEDHDLGLRAWRRGVPVVVDPAVRWVHSWQRETTRARLAPWRHELRSARIFYRTYPELISRRRFARSDSELRPLENLIWQAAGDV